MDFEFTSYDIELSESVTEELLSETLKTDFDFSEFKIANNHRNLVCQFYLREVMHDGTGPWTIASGNLLIDSGEVKINARSRWSRGGLSTDPKYLRDEVNLRITEDGYLVGKMAYFEWVGDGEPPKLPIYPRLLKHKKSIPLNYKNPTTGSAEFWLEKTLDWSDGVLHLSNCTMYEESYKDGKLDGKQTIWYQSGEIKSETNYKDGKSTGKTTIWYKNGQISTETNYIKGDGKETSWYKNGQISTEAHFKNNKREGKETSWYKNGQISTEAHFKNNKREGKRTRWYENGQIKSEDNFKDGNLDGTQTKWNKNGQIITETNYKEKMIPKVMIFDADFSQSDSDELSSSIENKAKFSENFENEVKITGGDRLNKWSVKKDIDGNSIYCNEASDDLASFHFGKEHWSDYSISLRMKFPDDKKSTGEVYIRINDDMEGYRVAISNSYHLTNIGFFPPYDRFAGGNVPVKRNEWFQIQLIFSGNNLKFFHDGKVVDMAKHDKRTNGFAGVGASPNSLVCVDDIVVSKI